MREKNVFEMWSIKQIGCGWRTGGEKQNECCLTKKSTIIKDEKWVTKIGRVRPATMHESKFWAFNKNGSSKKENAKVNICGAIKEAKGLGMNVLDEIQESCREN